MRKKTTGGGIPRPHLAHKRRNSTPRCLPLLSNQDERGDASYDERRDLVPESSVGKDCEFASCPEAISNVINDSVRQCRREHVETRDDDSKLHGREKCTECNLGGKVLVCSGKCCPLALHEKCIGSEPVFDSMGNFYCPHCWYVLVLAETHELREKVMLAKKALTKFLDQEPVAEDKAKQGDNMSEIQKQNVSIQKATTDCTDHDLQHKGKRVQDVSMQVGEGQQSVFENDQCTMRNKEQIQRTSMGLEDSKDEPIDSDSDGIPLRRRLTKSKARKERSFSSEHSKRKSFRGVRNRLFWRREEENMLREGVAKFATEKQKIPWTKILEFGRNVFDETRTPGDLKDKWRNLISK